MIDSLNSSYWRTKFDPPLTYYISPLSELGSLYGGFGNGYVPYNIVVGPGYQAYMVGNTFSTEAQMTVHIDAALANFQLYPADIPSIPDMYFNEQQTIDLSTIFFNGTGSGITFEVYSNSNSTAVTASINGSDLVIDSHDVMTFTDIIVKGIALDRESYVKLHVETLDPNLFINLYESFENAIDPTGWVLQTNNLGWAQNSDPKTGSFAAMHPYGGEDPQDDFLYTPKMTISGNAVLSFWEKTKYSAEGIHSIVETKDLGRFRNIAYNLPHTPNWQKTYIDLSSYDGDEMHVGFHYKFTPIVAGDESDIWIVDDVRLYTTTGINDNPVMINGNVLYQNYPNPFNPSTEIKFRLESNANVQLDVYNSKGEVVSSLVNSLMEKGSHSVNFNASELTGGIYFYKMDVDGIPSMTKKMLLLR